ncbi:MAG: tetratricopeptide repeat protein [Myxococcota bacterium]
MRWFAAALVLVSAVWACAPQVRPQPPVPPIEEAEARAEVRFAESMRAFEEHDVSGWTAAECRSTAAAFASVERMDAPGSLRTEAAFMAGMSHQRCGHVDAAIEAYRTALRIDDDHCRARVGLGLGHKAEGDLEAATSAFRHAVREDPSCTEGWVNLGVLERERGNIPEALANLRRALAIESDYVPAFHEMALAYLDDGAEDVANLQLVEVICRQAQLIDPRYAPIYNTWGIAQVQQGHVVAALEKFERAFELDPSFYEAWMNFGQITLSFRGYEDAERAFGRALGLRPHSYDALIGRGVALRGLQRVEEAEALYLRAQRVNPDRAESWFNLGVLHQDFRSGEPEDLRQAFEYFETFVGKAGADPELQEELAEVRRCCRSARDRSCRPGRLQNIRTALDALGAGSPDSAPSHCGS